MASHAPEHDSRGIGELVKDLAGQTSTLVRQEIRLAQAEVTQKGKLAGKGAGLLGGRSLGDAMSQALRGATAGAQLDRRRGTQNQTAAFLRARIPGLSDAEALAIAQDPKVMRAVLPQMLGGKGGDALPDLLAEQLSGSRLAAGAPSGG